MNSNSIPNLKKFRILLADLTGATYPIKTLSRRMRLLSKKEQKQVEKLYQEACDKFEKLEDIISMRAEVEKDQWP